MMENTFQYVLDIMCTILYLVYTYYSTYTYSLYVSNLHYITHNINVMQNICMLHITTIYKFVTF